MFINSVSNRTELIKHEKRFYARDCFLESQMIDSDVISVTRKIKVKTEVWK